MHQRGAVDVYTVDLTRPRPEILSGAESARAARFRFEPDRIHWSRAHSALREILAAYTNQPALDLAFTQNEHGKPALEHFRNVPGPEENPLPSRDREGAVYDNPENALRDFPAIHFNLTHSGDYALVAVCGVAPVGVDIERIRSGVDVAALLRRLGETNLPAAEFDLWQRWTAREASTKAAGSPLFEKPHARIHVQSITAPEGYAASIALDFSAHTPPDLATAIGAMIVETRCTP